MSSEIFIRVHGSAKPQDAPGSTRPGSPWWLGEVVGDRAPVARRTAKKAGCDRVLIARSAGERVRKRRYLPVST
ncbi:MAG: hypothetical protein MUQ20_03995 [Deltaproteobacteria bacterium]|nr:hypothetical protein [Deltaproteobacteria bacterium]